MSDTVHLSVVIPVYRGEDCLEELYRRLVSVLEATDETFEIVLVEDHGPDDSWSRIKDLSARDDRVRGFQLSRNFGQHHAITAGLENARGQWVVVMDCDLQDRPEEIPRLHAKAKEGFDCVLAKRKRRKDARLKRMSSWLFYKVFNYLTDLEYDGEVGNFSIISRRVLEQMNRMGEAVRFYGAFLTWLGFDRAYVEVQHAPRFKGESSYTLLKLFRMAMPIILAYSNRPLRLVVYLGLCIAAVSFSGMTWILARYFLYGSPVLGWPSLIVSVFFSTSAIIFVLGVLGLYLDRIFTEVKRRPLYVIRDSTDNG